MPERAAREGGPQRRGPGSPGFVNDPNASLARFRPFLLRAGSQLRTNGPHALKNPHYAREFDEVKAVGSLTGAVRTADQTDAARFWSGGFAPWICVAHRLSLDHRLGIVDNARLFAMLYLTATDAGIAVWDDKARWHFWRPVTAIRDAAADPNANTEPVDGWTPLIATPPYPDHPSGLTGFSSAFGRTLRDFFGSDRIPFSATSTASGATHNYNSFSQAIEEGVDARVWSGIHFRTADEDGAQIGERVARWRETHYFRPVHGH